MSRRYTNPPVARRKSSKSVVWLVVIVGAVIAAPFVCVVAGLLLWYGLRDVTPLERFDPPGGSCSILMPQEAWNEDTQELAGLRFRTFVFGTPTRAYRIGYTDATQSDARELDRAAKALAKEVDGEFQIRRSEIEDGSGYLEFEIRTERPRGYCSGRFAIAGGRLYLFYANGPASRLSSRRVKEFVASFEARDPRERPVPGLQPRPPRFEPPPDRPEPLPPGELLGFSLGTVETDHAPPGGVLVGFDVRDELFINYHIVRALRPLYLVDGKLTPGRQFGTDGAANVVRVVAKPGYAVGAITARTTTGIEGMSLTFMRIRGEKLDPEDSYGSDWVAGTRGQSKSSSGRGLRVTGIAARENGERVSAVGLIFDK